MRTFNFAVNKLGEVNKDYQNNYRYIIKWVSTSNNPTNNTLLFVSKLKDNTVALLENIKESLIIVPNIERDAFTELESRNMVLYVKNPRLEYAKILQHILGKFDLNSSCDYKCGNNTIVEAGAVVKSGAIIGDNCIIKSGAIINDRVIIGDGTIIRENSVIGGYGFGLERDESGEPVRIPHIGGVKIGNNVEIGALCTVVSGTIEPTLVGDGSKTDDHVHIAHNCVIGKNCLITACVEISGSVWIGDNVWIGPNASIMNGIKLGKCCFIGLGAVVTKSVEENSVVTGNPARDIELIKHENIVLKRMMEKYTKDNFLVE